MTEQALFKQFKPADVYAGTIFKGPGAVVPHKVVYCEIVNRRTGIELLDKFIEYLNIHGNCYARWYAYQLGLPAPLFMHAIEALTGLSCSDFMDRYLLLFITDLLGQTDDRIGEVARRASFPRPSELSQFLQRVCGRTPSQLRREQLSKASAKN